MIKIRWNSEFWILNSQEEIAEMMAAAEDGHGCKGCDAKVSNDMWCQIKCGEIFCWDCALAIGTELADVEVRTIATARQIRQQMEWAAAGVGAN